MNSLSALAIVIQLLNYGRVQMVNVMTVFYLSHLLSCQMESFHYSVKLFHLHCMPYKMILGTEIQCTEMSLDLMNHWIFCNVYTQTYTTAKKKIEDYLKEYNALKNYPKVKRKATHWTRVQSFVADCRKMMDIVCGTDRIKSQENMYGVKFDNEFYERQSSIPQIGYCTTFTEHKVSNIYTRCVFNNMVRTCDDQYKVFKCNYGLSSEYKISCA